MSERDRLALRQVFLRSYAQLCVRLARHLGSSETAANALQESWLRLSETAAIPRLRDPVAFVFRTASNLARDEYRAENRKRLLAEEICGLIDPPADYWNPERALEARQEIDLLAHALRELPERRRAIFLAARVHDTPHREIAREFGVSLRTVDAEIRRALDHCAARLERTPPRRCTKERSETDR